MNDNLIFLSDSDLDKPIYRIFSFSRLKDIFNERKMRLVKPKKWDDPFENTVWRLAKKRISETKTVCQH